MSDAIALVRPKFRERLLPHLDLDDENEESEGIYAEELDDGAFLLHTFQPFELFLEHPREARAWLLERFDFMVPELNDDPRGVLFFDDDDTPDAATYEAVVSVLGATGLWISNYLDDDEDEDDESADAHALAVLEQLLGRAPSVGSAGAAPPATSFDIGQMFEGVQRQLMESFGVDPAALHGAAPAAPRETREPHEAAEPPVIDSEFEPELPPK